MEFQFQETGCEYLRSLVCETVNTEQTQEVRLPEAMPDVGRVLAAWGQPLVRSKEWRSNAVGVSGGVMAWVLYAPEDSSGPRSLEAWLPFQLRWDLPDSQRDGILRIGCQLTGMDARSLSARKLMLRAQIGLWVEALEPAAAAMFAPEQVPGDLQLLEKTFPVTLAREAGEKTFSLDEEFPLPSDWVGPEKLIRYSLHPELTDWKLLGNKGVFRGTVLGHALVRCRDGQLRDWDFEVPFSQYGELDREYGEGAQLAVEPNVTNLEMELSENGMLRLKAGLVGQYLVYDRVPVRAVTDAYSTNREVRQEITVLRLPAVLDMGTALVTAEKDLGPEEGNLLDLSFGPACPRDYREGEGWQLELTGSFQTLEEKPEGSLRGETVRWEGNSVLNGDREAQLWAQCRVSGRPKRTGGTLRCDMQLCHRVTADTDIPMVSSLFLGEEKTPDPNRPSLVVRRAGEASLWELAKTAGTTVSAIRDANGLAGEPEPDQMLLIPVP